MINFPPPEEKSGFLSQYFIKFRVASQERFQALSRVFEVLRQEKLKLPQEDIQKRDIMIEKFIDDIFDLFDEQSLHHFWWPSNEEVNDHVKRWQASPISQRFTDPTLKTPWDFSSMIDSLLTGEYELLSCTLLTSTLGLLTFSPYSLPYGGSDAMKALIQSFDCEIIGEETEEGYISYL
jgi:hypothetical protein